MSVELLSLRTFQSMFLPTCEDKQRCGKKKTNTNRNLQLVIPVIVIPDNWPKMTKTAVCGTMDIVGAPCFVSLCAHVWFVSTMWVLKQESEFPTEAASMPHASVLPMPRSPLHRWHCQHRHLLPHVHLPPLPRHPPPSLDSLPAAWENCSDKRVPPKKTRVNEGWVETKWTASHHFDGCHCKPRIHWWKINCHDIKAYIYNNMKTFISKIMLICSNASEKKSVWIQIHQPAHNLHLWTV